MRPGFTLVECLVAGVVLALFGAAIMAAAAQAMNANEKARYHRDAAMFLDELLTRIDAIGPSVLLVEGPVEGEIGEGFFWTADIEQGVSLDLYAVTVTVSRMTARGVQSAQAYTLMHDPVGSRPIPLLWEDLDGL